jgi:hypothetical protein
MNKSYLVAVLALTCLLGISAPAGTYHVGRASSDSRSGLMIQSYGNSAVYVLPIVFDGASAEQAKLDFEYIGNRYFLSDVETPAGIYTIALPRAAIKLGQMKEHDTMSSSGN